MIGIIDCDIGNIGSIINIMDLLREPICVVHEPSQLKVCDKFIFPGVGAFDTAVTNTVSRGLDVALSEQVLQLHKPILGICVGAQIFCRGSEEGQQAGFGWIDTEVIGLDKANIKYVPHLGWNKLNIHTEECLLKRIQDPYSRFYFLHSYYIDANCEECIATADCGVTIAAAYRKKNIWGVQFHPEKSHKYGIQLFRNFCEIQ